MFNCTKFTLFLILGLSFFIKVTSCGTTQNIATPTVGMSTKTLELSYDDTLLNKILQAHPQYFDTLLKEKDRWGIQIIYTQINRSRSNKPTFTHYYFNVDPAKYHYPASTVKLPVAALALQRLNELKIAGLDRNTTMITEPGMAGLTPVYNDPTSEDGRPTIAHYIKKILLVSDNDAFNRLYEFLGQEYINNTLYQMGYGSAQILHRLSVSMNEEQQRHTNPVTFFGPGSSILYKKSLVRSDYKYQPRNTFLGNGFYKEDSLIKEPFDFSKKNRLSLPDLHSIVQSIVFPESVAKKQRFTLTAGDHHFLMKYMSMKPGESRFPQYDTSYNDAFVKFLLYGGKGNNKDEQLRIFNKIGDAYGFLIDAAYMVDFKNDVEFMLSATINCNSDGIYNDDKYEYEKVGFPFMKALGEVIYNYEVKRSKKTLPDLSAYKMAYGQ